MSIGAIGGSQSIASLLLPSVSSAQAGRSGDCGGVGRTGSAHHGGRSLVKSIAETLKEMGLESTSLDPATAASGTGSASATSTAAADATQKSPALSEFLHALFQALKDGAPAQKSGDHGADKTADKSPLSAVSGYGTLGTKLQGLLQSLGSANGSNPDLTALTNEFQDLVKTSAGNSGSTAHPSLQSFLQTLIQNLGAQQASTTDTAAVGGLLNLAA